MFVILQFKTKSKFVSCLLVMAMVMMLLPGAALAEGEGDPSSTPAPPEVGSISGKVTDSSSSPLAGVNITVSGRADNAVSDVNGEYFIKDIPTGTYSVTFEKSGYVDKPVTDIAVTAGGVAPADCQMEAQIVKYTVTFDKNGGTTNADPSSTDVVAGKSVDTLPIPPDKTSFTFNGWNTVPDGSGTAFTSSTSVSQDMTVYAQWEPIDKPVTSITVTGSGGKTSVLKGQTLQMTATVSPSDAGNKNVTWSVEEGTGRAYIDPASGVLTGVTAGSVIVTATAKDGSNVSGSSIIKITSSGTRVTRINVYGEDNATAVMVGDSLQMNVTITPNDAADKTVTWSVTNGTGSATITSKGLLKGVKAGSVTVKATANDGSKISGTKTISITSSRDRVTRITIYAEDDATSVAIGESLQMYVTVTPSYADDKSVTWDVTNGTGSATITSRGLLKGVKAGSVTVKATANDGSKVTASKTMKITEDGGDNLITSRGLTIKEFSAIFKIPSGAVRTDTSAVVERLNGRKSTLPADSIFVGYVYELTKDRSGDFLKPMIVTLPYSNSSVDTKEYTVTLYWYDTRNGEWVELDEAEVSRTAISGESTKVGEFAIIATKKVIKPIPPVTPVVTKFTDITRHWAKADIEKLVKLGAISGYPDKTFRPESSITRAEFATIIVKTYGLTGTGKVFNDTRSHWAKNYISTAYAAGIISGYSEWSFGPDDKITREQMAVMIIKAARLNNAKGTLKFSDTNSISSWAKQSVGAASEYSLISGYPDNTFRPKNNATRAEAASIIIRAQG